jgi:hypothetical protein
MFLTDLLASHLEASMREPYEIPAEIFLNNRAWAERKQDCRSRPQRAFCSPQYCRPRADCGCQCSVLAAVRCGNTKNKTHHRFVARPAGCRHVWIYDLSEELLYALDLN